MELEGACFLVQLGYFDVVALGATHRHKKGVEELQLRRVKGRFNYCGVKLRIWFIK
jgi:hypothetical protein